MQCRAVLCCLLCIMLCAAWHAACCSVCSACCMLHAACCNYADLHAVCCSVVHCAALSALHNDVCCMACCMLLCLLCILCAAWPDVCCSAVHCAALSALHCPAAYQAVLGLPIRLPIPSGCLSGCLLPQAARSGCGCSPADSQAGHLLAEAGQPELEGCQHLMQAAILPRGCQAVPLALAHVLPGLL